MAVVSVKRSKVIGYLTLETDGVFIHERKFESLCLLHNIRLSFNILVARFPEISAVFSRRSLRDYGAPVPGF